jgi:cyclophilin family peptidyl-prolyl cis-trans isomerase
METRAVAGVVRVILILASAIVPLQISSLSAEVAKVPEAVRREWKLDPFYQRYIAVGALPIVSSTNSSNAALSEAAYLIEHMLAGRSDIINTLAEQHVKVVVMAHNEYTTDLPEQRNMTPKVYWDSRARGLGGRTCSCAEENLLCFPGDPYAKENILIHEFSHVIHGQALRKLDPTFNSRLQAAFTNAMQRGLWRGTYSAVNAGEYWAESVQEWFDAGCLQDALHNEVHTRAQLKQYDPGVATLCAEVFGDRPWIYQRPMERPASERAHWAGFDAARAPQFHWRDVPIPDKPRVQIETESGNIVLELDAKAAPVTTANFLRYAHERLYNNGSFFRTVTLSNQPNDRVKIQVIQAGANPEQQTKFYPPIKLERTRDTGLHHLDGTISMARDGPDTAQDNFFICIGDQPELDFAGRRNPDGQGFAAFGHVVEGMDLVRKIHGLHADGQQLNPPFRIQRAIRLN